MSIRAIPHNGPRVETGVVQFRDDWPGIFIRGDDALYYAMVIEAVMNGDQSPFTRAVVMNIPRLLRQCHASVDRNPEGGDADAAPSRSDESAVRDSADAQRNVP